MKQTIKTYLETTCGQTCNNGSEEGSEEAASVIISLIKKWALEMVGKDSDLGQAIADSEGSFEPSSEDIAQEIGFNKRGDIIKARIEESLK